MTELPNLKQQIYEELRRMWSENDTEIIMVVIDEKVGGLAEKLEELETVKKMTSEEIHEFLYEEDDRGNIFNRGIKQGKLVILEKVLSCLRGENNKP